MTDFTVNLPDGRSVVVKDVASEEEAAHAARNFLMRNPAPSETTAGKAMDAVNSGVNWLGTQFTKGITSLAGAPAALGELGQKGAEWVGERVGAPEMGKAGGQAFRSAVTFGGAMQPAETYNRMIFGDLGVPEVDLAGTPSLQLGKYDVGKMLDAGVQAIPGMLALPAGPVAAGASRIGQAAATAIPAFTGGAASEAGGQIAQDTPYEIPARVLGGTLGYMAGSKAVTPLPANLTPEQQRLVDIAKEKNIPMTVGQETGRLRGVESALARFPTSQGRMSGFADEQQQAINRDLFGQIGQAADRSDPTTMNRVIATASADFNRVKNAAQSVTLDRNFFNEIGDTLRSYFRNTPPSNRVPAVSSTVQDAIQAAQAQGQFPQLTGAQYQELRKSINDAATANRGSGAGIALKDMRKSLDDAMERSLPADMAAEWKRVRGNWAGLKVLEKAAAGGSLDSRSAGNFTPGALSGALRQAQGTSQFSSRLGGMNDTARVAGYLADTRPNSGTPATLTMQSMLTGGPIAAGFAAGGIPGAAAGAGAAALPNIFARAMTGTGGGQLIRPYLTNQAMVDSGLPYLLGMRSLPEMLAPGTVVALPRMGSGQ